MEPLHDPGRAFVEAHRGVHKLRDDEIEALVAKALSREHWAEIAPDLSIEGARPPALVEARPLADAELRGMLRTLQREGWFAADPLFAPSAVLAMKRAIEALVARGFPPVLAYVYDELWHLTRSPSVRRFLISALGPGYRLSPRVWAFCVPNEEGASGWPPHVDGGAGTHTPDRITLWIPLGDATLDNGCMYIVPKHRLPEGTADVFANDMSRVSPATWRAMLQATKAMPAPAGALMGWDFQVIHWSSLASGRASTPRVSLAVEAFGEGIAPTPSEEPLLDPEGVPPFLERLRAIARGVLSYERFEPGMLRFGGFARRLLDTVDRLG